MLTESKSSCIVSSLLHYLRHFSYHSLYHEVALMQVSLRDSQTEIFEFRELRDYIV